MSGDEDSKSYEIQKVFGAGFKRKRINFVPAEKLALPKDTERIPLGPNSVKEVYLSIVFRNGAYLNECYPTTSDVSDASGARKDTRKQLTTLTRPLCELCHLPISATKEAEDKVSKPHESSMTHQICLTHSHPPSNLDRKRQGLKYLSSYGWDPDSRFGLGATGAGIRVPIKAKGKDDTVGLGIELKGAKAQEKKVERLDAKQARMREKDDRKKRERLQDMFYRNDDVDRYLVGS